MFDACIHKHHQSKAQEAIPGVKLAEEQLFTACIVGTIQ